MDVYIASPFFNPDQLDFVKKVETALEGQGLSYFSPRLEGVIKDMSGMDPEKRQAVIHDIYESNIANIVACEWMLAVIDDWDTGTVFEMGYAAAMGKPIVSLTNRDYGLNVMISQTVFAHTADPSDAASCIAGEVFQRLVPRTDT